MNKSKNHTTEIVQHKMSIIFIKYNNDSMALFKVLKNFLINGFTGKSEFCD